MYIRLLALTVLMSSSVFGMQNNKVKLSHNQLIAVMRTTVITQAVVESLYRGLGVTNPPVDATSAIIAEQIGTKIIEMLENGTTLTDSTVKEIIIKQIGLSFSTTALKKIRHFVNEESKKLKDGIVPLN